MNHTIKDLNFDEKSHTYYIGDNVVPNVTSAIGLFASNYANIPLHVLEKAAERGKLIHLATEYDDRDELDYDSLPCHLKPYVDAWRRFRKETGFHPTVIENRVYHPLHKYAGTLDRIGILKRSKVLIDIKTGSALKATTGPQTAAYEAAYRYESDGNNYGAPLPRYGCELHSDGSYQLKEFNDPNDLPAFLASLTLLRWREDNGY